MPSGAIAAYGTLFKKGTLAAGTASQSYATLGEVKNISGPSTEVSVIDVTTHSSAASGNYREYVPSLIDPGTIDVDLNWVHSDTTHQGLWTDMTARTKRDWRIQVPVSQTGGTCNMDFQGYIVAMPKEFPVDDVVGAKLTIQVTGAIAINTTP